MTRFASNEFCAAVSGRSRAPWEVLKGFSKPHEHWSTIPGGFSLEEQTSIAILDGMRRRAFGLLLFLNMMLAFSAWGQPQVRESKASAEANEFFEKKVRPLLANKCSACHGSKLQMAGLNLSTAPAFLKGSDNGPIILKGEPENSKLMEVVGYQGKIKMPPSAKLRDDY